MGVCRPPNQILPHLISNQELEFCPSWAINYRKWQFGAAIFHKARKFSRFWAKLRRKLKFLKYFHRYWCSNDDTRAPFCLNYLLPFTTLERGQFPLLHPHKNSFGGHNWPLLTLCTRLKWNDITKLRCWNTSTAIIILGFPKCKTEFHVRINQGGIVSVRYLKKLIETLIS